MNLASQLKPATSPDAHDLAEYVRTKSDEFRRRLGRPLRVLHIGNIANNAYVNAKIMRRLGIEADVLVIDYYHVMGCPEWEEGVIVELAGTHDRPDWNKSLISSFERPTWFVQGPEQLCLRYLRAKQRSSAVSKRYTAPLLWYCMKLSGAQSGPQKFAYNTVSRFVAAARRLISIVPRIPWILLHKAKELFGSAERKPSPRILNLAEKSADLILAPVLIVAAFVIAIYRDLTRRGRSKMRARRRMDPSKPLRLSDTALAKDTKAYMTRAQKFKDVFAYYDVVQGYSTDGIYPLLAGKRTFACYEHGTLRDVPFQDDRTGRICSFTYRNAPVVFITNTDCVAAADKLGIPKERQYPLPHAFDSDRVVHFQNAHAETYFPRNDPVTFISPARHHWKKADMLSWLKGNDVVIRAARLLADENLKFKIIVVRWGREVSESERLMSELGVEDFFEWIDPAPKARLWEYYMSCNGVFDQFTIPAIGSVSFEALAFGRPLFTRIDEKVFADFFGESPPLFNVHTPEGLAAAVAPLIRDPSAYRDVEEAARRWAARYHSSDRILQIQLDAYEKLMSGTGPTSRQIADAVPTSGNTRVPVAL